MGWREVADGVMAAVEGAFGEPAAYEPAAGRPGAGTEIPLAVAFDEAFELIEAGGEGPGYGTTAPAAALRAASLPAGVAPYRGDRLACRGRDWRVVEVQPDGQAGLLLILEEA